MIGPAAHDPQSSDCARRAKITGLPLRSALRRAILNVSALGDASADRPGVSRLSGLALTRRCSGPACGGPLNLSLGGRGLIQPVARQP
jgi:hypothetical protein